MPFRCTSGRDGLGVGLRSVRGANPWRAFALLASTLLSACSEPGPIEPKPPIAETYQARCGNCHARIEPHSRTRAELESAFQRHRARTRLSDEQWKQLEDYLASDAKTARLARH
jgi:hypothetical protein